MNTGGFVYIPCLLVSFCVSACAITPMAGTRFVAAIPQLYRHCTMSSSLYFMTSEKKVSVVVETHPTSSLYFKQELTVVRNKITSIAVDHRSEPPVGCVITNDALIITASSEVIIDLHLNTLSNGDLHRLIPYRHLGTEHYAAGFRKSSSGVGNFILITASSDNTEVKIVLNKLEEGEVIELRGVKYGRTDVLRATLNVYQSLQIQAKSDLTGTKITSNHPIGVYSGQNQTEVSKVSTCLLHLSVMVPSVKSLGKKFVLVATPQQTTGDLYRFISTRAKTKVVILSKPKTMAVLLDPGDFYEYDIEPRSYVYAKADKPVMVVLIRKSSDTRILDGARSMAILTPTEKAENMYLMSYKVKKQHTYILFTVLRQHRHNLRLNGRDLTDLGLAWSTVEFSNYYAGFVTLNNQTTDVITLRHKRRKNFNVLVVTKDSCEVLATSLTCGERSPGNSSTTSETCSTGTKVPGDTVYKECNVDNRNQDRLRSSLFHGGRAQRKQSDTVITKRVRSRRECCLACLEVKACFGVNFSPSATLISDPNCELLAKYDNGTVDDNDWNYFVRVSV